jgi:2-oxoglutarate ferredoxin oxidoreductase subunit beta
MSARVYAKSEGLTEKPLHYCPGCAHGNVHKLIAEALVELDVLGYTVGVAPVGCSVFAYEYFNCDMQGAAHGRAPAVATGIKRALPEAVVFAYQGDGDIAAIGTGEIVHAAHRSENITCVFINNAIYGMTGGQMAPTTLEGQRSTTSPQGRDAAHCGKPIRVSEMLAAIPGASYVARVSVHDIPHQRRAKAAIKRAFRVQLERKGFSLVEVLAICPTNWAMSPLQSLVWLKENMIPYYPLGVIREPGKEPGEAASAGELPLPREGAQDA